MLKTLSLFSGIGGFDLGLERTGGFRTAAFCEIDPYCRSVLARHWPDVPCHEDVTRLRGEDVGTVDVICGGFPCQPWSVAGERRGENDDRHLWPEMVRLVRELKPSWVIGENVAGIVSMGLDLVLDDLEASGYATWQAIIPAAAVGACHRRDRVWIVAYAVGERSEARAEGTGREAWIEPRRSPAHADQQHDDDRRHDSGTVRGERSEAAGLRRGEQISPNTNGQRLAVGQGVAGGETEKGAGAAGNSGTGLAAHTDVSRRRAGSRDAGGQEGQRRRDWRDLERRIADAWSTPQPPFCRVDDGLSEQLDSRGRISTGPTPKRKSSWRKRQLTALGNAVHPIISEAIGYAILEAEAHAS